jgi:glycosyltransferase involved in cell wall biosynthesis
MSKETIIFDAQVLQTPALNRGMGQYVLALLRALAKESEDTGAELIVLLSSHSDSGANKKLKLRLGNISVVELPLWTLTDTPNTKEAISHNKIVIEQWASSENSRDISFIVGSLFQAEVYPAFPDSVRKLAIMYDVIPLQMFERYAPKMRWGDYLSRYKLVYDADKLLCISKTTATDLQLYAGVRPQSIALIKGGPGELESSKEPAHMPDRPFILMPTGNDIRKNNQLAIEAFELFRLRSGKSYELLVTSHFTEEETTHLKTLSPAVTFTGVVSDSVLTWYYANCSVLLFPSTYEGLGMPLIESMVFKKPIAASNIDVFLEISETAPFFFDPANIEEMVNAIHTALVEGVSDERKKEYARVLSEYTWQNTAKLLLKAQNSLEYSDTKVKKKIAVVGPHVTGVSAIGKFIAELHPSLSTEYDVEYYYERSLHDKVLRPDIIGHITNYQSVYGLTDAKMRTYEAVIYHIGNSDHHMVTAARALTKPGIVILHDMNLENIYKALVKKKIICEDRMLLEARLDSLSKTKSAYVQSLVKRQSSVIVHSKYLKNIIDEITNDDSTNVALAQLPISTPIYASTIKTRRFTIGLAGILAGIKGLEVIEKIARHPEFLHDKFMLFGLNFAEPGLLERIRELPNVEVTTDLSDFEFQEKLKRLDLFVNYRKKYQGEASYSTLEAMRFGVPVLVRSDFGWYSELPDGSVIKVKEEKDIITAVLKLKNNAQEKRDISEKAREVTKSTFNAEQYVEVIKQMIENGL